ncbi:hypothetical protein SAFG77S_08052 [Streptomyces afghaniensis]
MTLLVAIIRENQCVLSGDYRITSVNDESEYYDIVRKVVKANEKLLIGYSGDVHITERLSPILKDFIKEKTSADAAARKARQWLIKNTSKENYQTVIFVGKSDNGRATIITVSNYNHYKINKQQGFLQWRSSFGTYSPMPYIEQEVPELNQDIKDLTDYVRNLNYRVSKQDRTVSEKCEVLSIII